MADGSKAPAMWGIDPDCLYAWTPREGRELLKEAVYEGEGADRRVKTPNEYGKALPGTPVIVIAPLTEALYLRVSHAQEAYRRARAKDAEGAEEAYSPELMADVLAASIKAFRDIKTPGGRELSVSGDIEKDLVKIRPWRLELFFDIIAENAYTVEDVEGFTSPLGSPPA